MRKQIDIKTIRLFCGYSQKELSEKYEIPLNTIHNWEQGIHMPPDYFITLFTRCIKEDLAIDKVKEVSEEPLREFREALNISRAELSKMYNIPIRTIEGWEYGHRTPPKYIIYVIKRCLLMDISTSN